MEGDGCTKFQPIWESSKQTNDVKCATALEKYSQVNRFNLAPSIMLNVIVKIVLRS